MTDAPLELFHLWNAVLEPILKYTGMALPVSRNIWLFWCTVHRKAFWKASFEYFKMYDKKSAYELSITCLWRLCEFNPYWRNTGVGTDFESLLVSKKPEACWCIPPAHWRMSFEHFQISSKDFAYEFLITRLRRVCEFNKYWRNTHVGTDFAMPIFTCFKTICREKRVLSTSRYTTETLHMNSRQLTSGGCASSVNIDEKRV